MSEQLNKVCVNIQQEFSEQEKAQGRTNIGAQAQLTAGSNVSITNNVISATDTTYGVFSTSADGLVPKASGTGDTGKFLKGDGTWEAISTTVNATAPLYGSGTQDDPLLLRVSHGLSLAQPVGDYTYLQVTHPVPAPGSTSTDKVLTCADTLGNLEWRAVPTGGTTWAFDSGYCLDCNEIISQGVHTVSYDLNVKQDGGLAVDGTDGLYSTRTQVNSVSSSSHGQVVTPVSTMNINGAGAVTLDSNAAGYLVPGTSANAFLRTDASGNMEWESIPDLDVDHLSADGIEYYNLQSGDNYISLPWDDSRATILQMQSDASVDIYLETDSEVTVHSMLVLANAGQGGVYYCAHVVVHYNDELGNARTWDIPFGTSNQAVIIDAFMKKVGSGMAATSIGRVTVRKQDEAVQF